MIIGEFILIYSALCYGYFYMMHKSMIELDSLIKEEKNNKDKDDILPKYSP